MPRRQSGGLRWLVEGKRRLFWATVILGVGLDQATKLLFYYPPRSRAPTTIVPGFLEIESSQNYGGLFGMGQGRTWFFVVFSLAAIGYLVYLLRRMDPQRTLPNLAIGTLMAGALGNLYDRVVLAYVRDFIHMYYGRMSWPNYNVADILICTGVGLLMLELMRSRPPQKQAESAARADAVGSQKR